MKKIVLCLLLIFLLTACSSDKDLDLTKYEKLYQVNNLGTVFDTEDEKVFKIETSDISFYIYKQIMPEDKIYSSILSSIYNKHKNDLKEIAKKNNISIIYHHTIEDYIDKTFFSDCFMTINALDKNEETLSNFVNEVMEIEDIKNLYQIWLSNITPYYYVYDYSKFIYASEQGDISLFEYYKESSQEKKQNKEKIQTEETNQEEEKENSSQED